MIDRYGSRQIVTVACAFYPHMIPTSTCRVHVFKMLNNTINWLTNDYYLEQSYLNEYFSRIILREIDLCSAMGYAGEHKN